eukprot:TRINITY_DN4649_c0_g1_i4.p1 TRINITY_DN4649_c0_g1~~TRINITY_DN4649_c0_g1_i4.p1  ORF type:complete len:279 (+),score=36.11 TRINITY_DN4649_c0_g1_i4:342-1178(+)
MVKIGAAKAGKFTSPDVKSKATKANRPRRRLLLRAMKAYAKEMEQKREAVANSLDVVEEPIHPVGHMCGNGRCEKGSNCEYLGLPSIWCLNYVQSYLNPEIRKSSCEYEACKLYHPTEDEINSNMDVFKYRELANQIMNNTATSDDIKKAHANYMLPLVAEFLSGQINGTEKLKRLMTAANIPCSYKLPEHHSRSNPCKYYLAGMADYCVAGCPHHKAHQSLMPHCTDRYSQWHSKDCTNNHINTNPSRPICRDFQKGNCAKRLLCADRHTYFQYLDG